MSVALTLGNSLCLIGELKHELGVIETLLDKSMQMKLRHLRHSVVESINQILVGLHTDQANVSNDEHSSYGGSVDNVRAIASYKNLLRSKIPGSRQGFHRFVLVCSMMRMP